MSNAFINAASKARRLQDEQIAEMRTETNTGGGIAKAVANDDCKEGNVVMTVRIPCDLHRKAMQHRIDSGESITRLVTRLLERELCDR